MKIIALTAAALAIAPSAALCDPKHEEPAPEKARAIDLGSATNETQSGLPASAITAAASSDASSVSLTVATGGDRILRRGGQAIASITANAPLNENKTEGSFLTEQGLPDQLSVDAGVTFIFAKPAPTVLADVGELAAAYDKKCGDDVNNSEAFRTLATHFTGTELGQHQSDLVAEKCQLGKSLEARSRELLEIYLTPDERKRLNAGVEEWRKSGIWLLSFSGGVGYRNFNYLDAVSSAKLSQDKVSHTASASVGYNPGAGAPFWGFGYQYRKTFKAAEKQVICPAGPSTAPVTCQNEIFGPPTTKVEHTAFALVRSANLFGLAPHASVANVPVIEMKVAYDFHHKAWGASLPVYLFLDSDKEYKGGIRVAWEEKPDPGEGHFKFAIFIVKAFDFFGS